MRWAVFGQSLYWFSGAVGTNYRKLRSFYQWKLILHGCGGQKSEIKVSAGLCSLRRLQVSILPHLSQPLVSQGLLSLWPRPSSVPLLRSQVSLPLRLLSPLLSLRRIVSFIMVSPSFLFFSPYVLGMQDFSSLTRDRIWAPCIGSTESDLSSLTRDRIWAPCIGSTESDLSSLTRDRIWAPCIGSRVAATGPPEKSLLFCLF